jgi:flagellar basal-body rod protein FlgF
MAVQQLRLGFQAENLANADTPGYRREALSVREAESGDPADRPPAVRSVHIRIDATPGPLRTTGNPLDLALDGAGFFCVETPEGVRYTRNGSFRIGGDGVLVTSGGHPVLGEAGPILLPEGPVTIDSDGAVEAGGLPAGRLRIGDFAETDALRKAGNGLYAPVDPESAEIRPAEVRVVQGGLEGSNVSPVAELTRMIATQRLFESYQRVIQAADEMDQKAVTELGRVE